MKILITGAGGMLGTDLCYALAPHYEIVGLGRSTRQGFPVRYLSCDLTHRKDTSEVILKEKPDWILHAAAMTAVDKCETEQEEARRQNVQATETLVDLANQIESKFVFFSTDYVFSGKSPEPYLEDAPTAPVNFYGETKLLAERYIQQHCMKYMIFRVSWLFGIHNSSFPEMVLSWASKQKALKIVSDQWGRPTFTKDIALALKNFLIRSEQSTETYLNQIYHLGNEQMTSWFEYAKFILSLNKRNEISVYPISANELKRPAARPQFSILNLTKAKSQLGIELRSWKDAVKDYLNDFSAKQGAISS